MIAFVAALALATDTATADPNATANVDGIVVTVANLQTLFEAYRNSQGGGAISIKIESKPAAQMPWYDPHWHYVGSSGGPSTGIVGDVWVNADDMHAKNHYAKVGIVAGILLMDMESGFAGPYWQKFYAAEASRDQEAAARGDNPSLHRDSAADRIAEALVNQP
jgi:hypothetical protein